LRKDSLCSDERLIRYDLQSAILLSLHTEWLFVSVVPPQKKGFTADSTVLKVFREFFVALLMHDMRTIRWLYNLLPLKTCRERFTANGAGSARKI